MVVLGYLWALPNTALGLVLGTLSFQVPRAERGVVMFDRAERGFLWLFGRTGRTAITFGHVILSLRRLEGRLLNHELAHVRQYEALGPLFIPVYLALFVVRGYRRHPLELAAARAAAGGSGGSSPGA